MCPIRIKITCCIRSAFSWDQNAIRSKSECHPIRIKSTIIDLSDQQMREPIKNYQINMNIHESMKSLIRSVCRNKRPTSMKLYTSDQFAYPSKMHIHASDQFEHRTQLQSIILILNENSNWMLLLNRYHESINFNSWVYPKNWHLMSQFEQKLQIWY